MKRLTLLLLQLTCVALSLAAVRRANGLQVKDLAASDAAAEANQQHPAPEPYSFSYEAESIGGFASRQESGDAQGRVTGFYTILGEDGRERRVDYVADENGYRAKVSTNEVGTRSEPSADVGYNSRLPSGGQLEQANVTEEQYKYLEAAHANERQRHLAQLGANSAQQQFSRQQQFSTSQQPPQLAQQFSGSGNTEAAQQQQNSQPDLDWRTRNLAASSLGQQQRGQQLRQQQTSWNSRNQVRATANGAQTGQEGGQATAAVASEETSADSSPNGGADAPASQANRRDTTQQVQEAAWQLVGRGGVPTRRPITGLQRQLEQQFMQQAVQLTDQDYPRQWQTNEQLQRNAQAINVQRQQQFVAPPSSNNLNQLGLGDSGYASQQLGANNIRRPTASASSFNGQQDLNQFNQQQSNIIDEVGEVQLAVEQPQQQQIQQKFTTLISQQQPVQTTTFGPAPAGLVSIDLSNQQEVNNEQQREVAVERPQQELVVVQPQQQQQVKTQQQFVSEEVQPLQEIPTRPNSIKQIIEQQQQSKFVQPATTTTTTTTVAPTRQETTSRIVLAPVTTTTTPVPFVAATTQETFVFSSQQPTTTRQPSVAYTTTEAEQILPETEAPRPRPVAVEQQQQQQQQVKQVQQVEQQRRRPQQPAPAVGGVKGGRTSTVGFGSFQAGRIYRPAAPATSYQQQNEQVQTRPDAPSVINWTAQQQTTTSAPLLVAQPTRASQSYNNNWQRQQVQQAYLPVDNQQQQVAVQQAKKVSTLSSLAAANIQRQPADGQQVFREQQLIQQQQLVTRPPKFEPQPDGLQFKGGAVKGGAARSKSSTRKFWKQQPQVLVPASSNQQVVLQQNSSRAEYATSSQVDVASTSSTASSATTFGTRVAGR